MGWHLEGGGLRKGSFKKKEAFYPRLEGWVGFQVAGQGEKITRREEGALGTEERLEDW